MLREEEQADWEAARTAYRAAEQDPELRPEAIRGRRRCAERLRDDAALAEALRDELALDSALSRRDRQALARQLGEVSWQRLGSATDACLAYQSALDLDPTDRVALAALIAVKEAQGDRDGSIALYRRELALLGVGEGERGRRSLILLRLATLHAAAADGVQDAISAYQEAAGLGRLSAPDERALALLHERAGETRCLRRDLRALV